MLVGYRLHECKTIIDKLCRTVRVFFYCVACILGSVIIVLNGRINMVQNHYQNIILFFFGAILMCIPLIEFLRLQEYRENSIKHVFSWWGKNTIIFMGFNDLLNVICVKLIRTFNLQCIGAFLQIVLVIIFSSFLIALNMTIKRVKRRYIPQ